MGKIVNISQGLETISKELEKMPLYLIAVAGVLLLTFLFLYVIALKKKNMDEVQKKWLKKISINGMLLLFLTSIIVITLLCRVPGKEYRVQLRLFNNIMQDHMNRSIIRGVCNMALFIPIGFLLHWESRKLSKICRSMVFAFGLSLLIETLQLISRKGTFDVDDILFNVAGAIIGIGLVKFVKYVFGKKSALRYLFRVIIAFFLLLFLLITLSFFTYHVLRVTGAEYFVKTSGDKVPVIADKAKPIDEERKPEAGPGQCYYEGKLYQYNSEIINILCMGIDKKAEEIDKVDDNSGQSGQADAIFIVSLNPSTKKTKIISIPRDTMTMIDHYDYSGKYTGRDKNHLGLAYSYGDGKEKSCQLLQEAVSNLMYQLPIHSYCALNLNALSKLNDAVGGVTVTIPQSFAEIEPSFQAGEKVTLKGSEATLYIQKRDMKNLNGNDERIKRQKQYLVEFFKTAKSAISKNPGLPVNMYQDLTDQMVSDLGINQAVYLIGLLMGSDFNINDMVNLPGKTVKGTYYAEYHVDEDALYEMLINFFYEEVEDE